jgi:hypothetical protein
MYRAERDLFSGEVMMDFMFFNLQSDKQSVNGELITCLNCGVIPLGRFNLAEHWRRE